MCSSVEHLPSVRGDPGHSTTNKKERKEKEKEKNLTQK
jgi:hypothetical protein